MTVILSNCCNANVRVEGRTTQYYVCCKCGHACDASLIAALDKAGVHPATACSCYEPGRVTDPKCPTHGKETR